MRDIRAGVEFFARLSTPALLTARGFAYHVRTLMDAHVVLSPSFPFFSPADFRAIEKLLAVYIQVASDRVWQATLENEELGKKKGRARSNAGLNSRPYGLNERTSRDIALCSANHRPMLHLDIDN